MFSLRFWAVMTTSSTAAEVGSVGAGSGASRAVSAAAEGAAAHIATTKAAADRESRRTEGLLADRPGGRTEERLSNRRLTFSTPVNKSIAPSKNSRLRKRVLLCGSRFPLPPPVTTATSLSSRKLGG